jgi:hypothetical protein
MDKSEKHYVEFFETRENSAKAFEAAEEAFDLVATAIQGPVVFPGVDTILFRRDDGDIA